MNKIQKKLAAFVAGLVVSGGAAVGQSSAPFLYLTGEEALSCEAWLCLYGAKQFITPKECKDSLAFYEALGDEMRRQEFLQQCPKQMARDYAGMLVQQMTDSNQNASDKNSVKNPDESGVRCSAAFLNAMSHENGGYISDNMSSDCQGGYWVDNSWFPPPRYVGVSEDGGYWAEAEDFASETIDYERAHAKYDLHIKINEQLIPEPPP